MGSTLLKIDYSYYLKRLISRINEVYVFSIKYRYRNILLKKYKLHLHSDILLKTYKLHFSRLFSRYRTLTIYNVLFEQNKMAEVGIRNTTTGDSVGVSCFYSHKGPSWIHV